MNKENNVLEEKKVSMLESVIDFVVVFAIVFALLHFVVCPTLVIGPSMEPTYHNSDIVVFTRVGYTPDVNDVIAFHGHGDYDGVALIKRIMAVPGDEVNVESATGIVTVNGKVVVSKNDGVAIQKEDIAAFPAIVPEDHYFVLGDNRKNSEDSRYAPIGMIARNDIIGEKIFSVKLSKIGG